MNTSRVVALETQDDMGNPERYEVGVSCIKIEEHRPAGEGDKWFYDIETVEANIRIFTFDRAYYFK